MRKSVWVLFSRWKVGVEVILVGQRWWCVVYVCVYLVLGGPSPLTLHIQYTPRPILANYYDPNTYLGWCWRGVRRCCVGVWYIQYTNCPPKMTLKATYVGVEEWMMMCKSLAATYLCIQFQSKEVCVGPKITLSHPVIGWYIL